MMILQQKTHKKIGNSNVLSLKGQGHHVFYKSINSTCGSKKFCLWTIKLTKEIFIKTQTNYIKQAYDIY